MKFNVCFQALENYSQDFQHPNGVVDVEFAKRVLKNKIKDFDVKLVEGVTKRTGDNIWNKELTLEEAKETRLFDHCGSVEVMVSFDKKLIKPYLKRVVEALVNCHGNTYRIEIHIQIDTEQMYEKWVEAGCPLKFNLTLEEEDYCQEKEEDYFFDKTEVRVR